MNITLARNNESSIDTTKYLDDTYAVKVRQEIERKAFQRAVGDLRLRLSDLDNTITALFTRQPPTTAYRVDVYDAGRRFFYGYIDNDTVDFSVKGRWMECDVFSANKAFFDKAKTARIFQPMLSGFGATKRLTKDYITLFDLLTLQFSSINMGENVRIFRSLNLGEYALRKIRAWSHANEPIGDEGRFADLHPETTIDDLLKAMAYYYNAEFWIDPVTTDFVMQRRGAKNPNLRSKVIEDYLCEDVEPHVIWLDGQRVDYLYTYALMAVPAPTFTGYVAVNNGILPLERAMNEISPGFWSYVTTCMIDGKESVKSLPLEVTVPPVAAIGQTGWQLRVFVPPGPEGTTERKLYRNFQKDLGLGVDYGNYPTDSSYRCVTWLRDESGNPIDLKDNVGKVIVDQSGALRMAMNAVMPENVATFANQWVRYDEALGAWAAPIYNWGNNVSAPTGIILDALPQLRFVDMVTREERTYDPYDIFSFFGRDNDFSDSRITEQWEPIFRSKRKLTSKLNTLDIMIGDELTTEGKPSKAEFSTAKNWIIRSAENDLMDKTTTLEAVAE